MQALSHSAVKEGKNAIVCTNKEEDFGNITKLAFDFKASYDASEKRSAEINDFFLILSAYYCVIDLSFYRCIANICCK